MQSHAGAAVLTLTISGFLSAYLSVYKRSWVIYDIFWPGGLLTFYGSFPWWMLIKQKTHFPLKCFYLICITLKALKLHPYRTKVQWVITKKVLNSKIYVATCFFFIYIYQLYQQIKDMKIWQQVLAQQMKPLISPILMILTPLKPLHS